MASPDDDNRVRDHLANQRTYLAWMRTGISMMGFGVVLAKLRYLFLPGSLTPPSSGIMHVSDIGLAFAVIGLLTVALSARQYRVVERQIREGRFEASGTFVTIFSSIIGFLGLIVIWYLIESSRVR